MVCCILQVGAGARVNASNVEQNTLSLCWGWLSKSGPVSVVMSICRGFDMQLCPLALSEGPCVFNGKQDFALAKG